MKKLLENKITYFVFGIFIGLIIMFFISPNRNVKLKNGNEVIVEFSNNQITIDELYNVYSDNAGISFFVDYIDKKILKEKYKDIKKEAVSYAKKEAEYYYESYINIYNKSKEDFFIDNGFVSEDAFIEYLENNYYKEKYIYDYLEKTISTDKIKEEYKNVFAAKDIITISSFDDKKTLEKIKNELSKNSIDSIKKKYNNVYYNEIDNVDYSSINTYSSDVIKAIKNTKKNKVSNVIADDGFGYVLIYVNEEHDKPSYEESKDMIIKQMIDKELDENPQVYYKAFNELRKSLKFNIIDKELNKKYQNYLNTILK